MQPEAILRLVDGYEHAMTSLERIGMQPEVICHQRHQSAASNPNVVWGAFSVFSSNHPEGVSLCGDCGCLSGAFDVISAVNIHFFWSL
jgi:hypothetical protein